MVTSGETQLSEIVERLIRLEVEMASNNQRFSEITNLLLEAIRENSRQIGETNRRIDTQGENLRREFRGISTSWPCWSWSRAQRQSRR